MDMINTEYTAIYLIAVNIIGFLLFALNKWLYNHTARGKIDILLMLLTLLGGSPGIVLAILLMDRKAEKRNMMLRVFVICVLIIQIVTGLLLNGFHGEELHFAFWKFFAAHKWFSAYLIVINVMTLVAFGIDKRKAIKKRSRIRIVTLLGLAFAGGSVGALIGMYLFRHKTTKNYFTAGIPLILVMQLVVLFFLMNFDYD